MSRKADAAETHPQPPTAFPHGVTIFACTTDPDLELNARLITAAQVLARQGVDVTFIASTDDPLGDPSKRQDVNEYSRMHGKIRCILWAPLSICSKSALKGFGSGRFLNTRRSGSDIDHIVRRSEVIVLASDKVTVLLPRIVRLNPGVRLLLFGTHLSQQLAGHRAATTVLLRCQEAFEAFLLCEPARVDFAWAYPKVRFVQPLLASQVLVDQVLGYRDDMALSVGHEGTDASSPIAVAPVLTLIVATLGRTEPLARLLSSLCRQDAGAFELIVVDQNPPGMLDTVLDRFSGLLQIRHLRSSPGLSRARNVGLAASKGRIVGFPDDDCWYPPDRVSDIIRFFSLFGATDVLLGQTVDGSGHASVNAVQGASQTVTPANIWYSGNSNTLFMHASLAKALRFDETLGVGAQTPFQSGEESDIILGALAQGARAIYCPNLKIYHDQVDNTIGRTELRRAWRYSNGFGQVLRRHYPIRYIGYRIVRSMGSGIIAACRGRLDKAAYRFAWGLGTLRGAWS